MEGPGYLGAIQAFSYYTGSITQVPLKQDGPDMELLEEMFKEGSPKVFYAIPNFQNPSGLTYSLEKRKQLGSLCSRYGTFLVEDDPYGDLRFSGQPLPPASSFMDGGGVMLGSLSKIVAPGLRVGWIVGAETVLENLLVAKQAADLHTSTFAQQVALQYLVDNDVDEHIAAIREAYGRQKNCMIRMIEEHFPPGIEVTKPEGGMFLWVTLPESCSSVELFEMAIKQKVAFVPGPPFYADDSGTNTMRLNFSNAFEAVIEEGIKRLGACIAHYLESVKA